MVCLPPHRGHLQVRMLALIKPKTLVCSYWDYLEATFDWVSTESIGESYEGQDMRVLKVTIRYPRRSSVHQNSITWNLVLRHIAPKSKIRPRQVCKRDGGCGSAPAMWVDGGIHANEWIGHAVASFIARWRA